MMKISGYAFFAGAAIAAVAAMGGCSSSSSGSPASAGSAEGESCSRSSDCNSGLVCIEDTCVTKGTVITNDAGQVIGPDGGVVAPPPVPDGSVAVTQPDGSVVVIPAEAAPPPRLSALGEYCASASDCVTGLICVPNSPVYGGVGVCDVANYGLAPSGKTCTGECNVAADCCQLPLNTTVGNTAVKTCEDIYNLVLTGNTQQCSGAGPTTAIGIGCFLYSTYCSSCATGTTWACTKNQCVYNASCQNSGVELSGCPSMTRTGRTLNTNCDVTSNTCKPATVAGSCVMDADCDTKPTTDTAYTCRGGDCTCYQQACYLKCTSDLNCHQGFSCNTTTKLCTQTAACSTNGDCATSTGVVTAQCVTGQCKIPCATDHQCGSSGLIKNQLQTTTFGGSVCGSDHFCAPLGCASDPDCQNSGSNPGGNSVHLFCVTPTPPTTVAVFQSAITN